MCRASEALEAILRPTGLLKLAEALEEKVWVTTTIAVLIALAAAIPYLPGKTSLSNPQHIVTTKTQLSYALLC